MKIISLNTWRGGCAKALTEYVRTEAKDTDIFLFQEASDEMEHIRSEELRGWQNIITSKYEHITGDDLCQMTCLAKDITLLVSGIFFPHNKNHGLGLWVDIMKGDERYTICNIHGAAFPIDKLDTEERLAQSREILEFLKDKPGKHIIMGDFNLFPDTQSVKIFEEYGYRNLIKDYNIDTTRNELAWAKYPNNKHLFADYCFVSADVEVLDFQVPKNEISDHLPMILEIA
ncbi:MAG: endonuclease/exonuclease/phosphatase family protein [Patescibacteria group bacterium]